MVGVRAAVRCAVDNTWNDRWQGIACARVPTFDALLWCFEEVNLFIHQGGLGLLAGRR